MRRYWTYQLAGWLGYSAVGITINLLSGDSPGPLIATHMILVSCGIWLTHLFRGEIRQRRRPDQPISSLWPILLTGTVCISAILAALVIGANIVLTRGTWDVVAVTALWWGMLLATGVWTLLYVRFSERRGHTERENVLQLSLREAQLRALESQINPHFLFNCLNSIRALVEIDPVRAQDMLTRLSNVLRNSLRLDHQHTVALSEEVEAVSDYLALETVRFADRLDSTVNIEESARRCPIPPMVLQTPG